MNDIVLMADPSVSAIAVHECGEALVDVRTGAKLLVDARKADPADHYAHLREGVLQRLLQAQDLLPQGLRLLFVEGYRPPSLQREYFDEYRDGLRAQCSELTEAELYAAASRYVSPPDIAPHSAGAAVDLTLADGDGTELDLGTRMNATPEESAGACYTHAPNISPEARAHRAALGAALSAAGLVNYPTEWWHWSYGDRYWALSKNAPAALYGPTDREA
ncbi:M15 family metallopeptidase [Streptomyces sp. NBC_01443]|uniref:M15 family metallopeptidase n=1 Tax=Streptomyces sp. NBC_01443 TaxID=2903868 RepID=UPI00225A9685|nr:M15 family metallopeptidase [Streptomyces sp. NBC_01443]MCX4632348.1 D-alanyl-D-alanine carboxypeptidase family protein [Streptomyces sp. NBC_01443]